MAKYNNDFFFQVTRYLFDEKYKKLSANAKWLYVVLCHLEHRFTGGKKDEFFTRSNEDLAKDSNMSLSTLKRTKNELKKTDLVKMWQYHFLNSKGEKSTVHYTAYKIKEWTWIDRIEDNYSE